MDGTFNLSALANRLAAEGRRLDLVGAIRKTRDLQSLHSDLKIAGESIETLTGDLETPLASNDFGRQVMQMALLNQAIVLYARATKSTSKHRKTYDITSKFNADEKVTHNEIVGLRDDAVAHYGSGKGYEGEWQSELLFIRYEQGVGRVAALGRRQITDLQLCKRMATQITKAMAVISDEFTATNALVTSYLNDPTIVSELIRHPLNLSIFLQSATAAEAVIASSADGAMARGLIDPKA